MDAAIKRRFIIDADAELAGFFFNFNLNSEERAF